MGLFFSKHESNVNLFTVSRGARSVPFITAIAQIPFIFFSNIKGELTHLNSLWFLLPYQLS